MQKTFLQRQTRFYHKSWCWRKEPRLSWDQAACATSSQQTRQHGLGRRVALCCRLPYRSKSLFGPPNQNQTKQKKKKKTNQRMQAGLQNALCQYSPKLLQRPRAPPPPRIRANSRRLHWDPRVPLTMMGKRRSRKHRPHRCHSRILDLGIYRHHRRQHQQKQDHEWFDLRSIKGTAAGKAPQVQTKAAGAGPGAAVRSGITQRKLRGTILGSVLGETPTTVVGLRPGRRMLGRASGRILGKIPQQAPGMRSLDPVKTLEAPFTRAKQGRGTTTEKGRGTPGKDRRISRLRTPGQTGGQIRRNRGKKIIRRKHRKDNLGSRGRIPEANPGRGPPNRNLGTTLGRSKMEQGSLRQKKGRIGKIGRAAPAGRLHGRVTTGASRGMIITRMAGTTALKPEVHQYHHRRHRLIATWVGLPSRRCHLAQDPVHPLVPHRT